MRVNWQAKSENVREIAKELNLGIESFIFVDDSPQECLSLRQAFPEMAVVTVPQQPVEIAKSLDDVPQLEVLSLTEEDRQRTEMYAAEQAPGGWPRKARAPKSLSLPCTW